MVCCQAGLALIGHLQHAQPSWVLGASAVEFQFKNVGAPTLGGPPENNPFISPVSTWYSFFFSVLTVLVGPVGNSDWVTEFGQVGNPPPSHSF